MAEKKTIEQKVNIPEGVTVTVDGGIVNVKGEHGESRRDLFSPVIDLKKADDHLLFSSTLTSKKVLRVLNTYASHVKNLIRGVQEKFVYEVKICSGHFPVTVKKDGNVVTISNFLGEKIPRKAKILDDVNVDIKGDVITIDSANIEHAGQTAANLEKATKIKNRDRRVFQDGCYIIKKPGWKN